MGERNDTRDENAMSETLPVRWGTDTPVLVARCPEHGLRGLRDTCDECGGPVEQIALVSADWLPRCEHNVTRANEAEAALAEALDVIDLYVRGVEGEKHAKTEIRGTGYTASSSAAGRALLSRHGRIER